MLRRKLDPKLTEALELLEESGDLALASRTFPEHAEFLGDFWKIKVQLSAQAGEIEPASDRREARARLLRTLAGSTNPRGPSLKAFRLGAIVLTGGIILTAALSASAAGLEPVKPANRVLESLGIRTETHGEAVRQAVEEALTQTPPGPERGRAVAAAACNAARDRTTLPADAQDAPNSSQEPDKACPEAESESDETDEDLPPGLQGSVPGPGRAQAAREAACQSAREQLPPGAPDPGVCQPFILEAEPETDEQPAGGSPSGPGRANMAREAACQQALAQQASGSEVPGVCRPRGEADE